MNRWTAIKVAAAIVATAVAMYFVLSQVSVDDLEALPHRIDPAYLALAFGLYLTANVARALRYRVLLGKRIGTARLLQVVFTQNFFNSFLPLRAGEVSYLVMVHQSGTVKPGANLASLVGARLLDFLAALLIPLAALPLTAAWDHPEHSVRGLAAIAAGAAGAIALFAALAIWQSARLARWLERRGERGEGRWHRGLRHLADAVRALAELRSGRVLLPVLALSFGCWLLLYLASATILHGAGLPISTADGVFVNGLPSLVSMTPLYMFGGFGLFEGTVVFGLTLVGVPTEQAVSTSLLAHVAELSMIILPALPMPLVAAYRARRAA
ncbi:MAG TPA: lysylphosphatidylglycerol synthase transmembrane domain-containing protein [Kofleriaceae bacterium]|nr:lysylphosphatidylglycerol synthase transmembrane domain-containing protein [Kofleriaceae bacterium]